MPLSPKILLYQQIVPHYRQRLFESLLSDCRFDIYLACDTQADSKFLKTVKLSPEARILAAPVRRIRFFGISLIWQPAVLRGAWELKPVAIIALGDPHALTTWLLLVYGRLMRVPILLWTHGLLEKESGPKWWIRRLFYKAGSHLLLYGERARELLKDQGYPEFRMHVVYNSLDYERQRDVRDTLSEKQRQHIRETLGLSQNARLVVFSGRLQANKRLDLLLKACELATKQGKIIQVALIGDGEEKGALTELAQRLGIAAQVHFLGEHYEETYIGQIYGASDLAVIPSGAGLSVMHALAYGTPVILHDSTELHFPEWEAVREGVNGFFFKEGNVEDLAAKMLFALFPEPKKNAMQADCIAVIEAKFNPERHAEAIIGAVERALEYH